MVVIILGTGFEEIETVAPCDILRRGGAEVRLAGIGALEITGSNGITLKADCLVDEIRAEDVELLMLPGGLGGVRSILESETAMKLITEVHSRGKLVSAICAAPTILAKLGITDGKNATCYPGMEEQMGSARMTAVGAVADGTVCTGRAAGSAMDFGYLLLEKLRGAETADRVRKAMVYTPKKEDAHV